MQTEAKSKIEETLRLAEIYVKPVDSEIAEKLISVSSVSTVYFTRINTNQTDLEIISRGTPLFSFHSGELSDRNDHEPDNDHSYISPEFHDLPNANIEQHGKDYIADTDGLFILEFNTPRIIPVSLDGSADVKVSDDSMFVYVDLYPSVDEHPIPSIEDITDKIKNLGITADINTELIERKLEDVKINKTKILDICVANGFPPKNGIDGRLENCTSKKEEIKNFDFDEFYKVNPVISVKDGDTIAIIHPPTKGESGINVFGKEIQPVPGKEYDIKLGKNTKYSEEDPTKILATLDGFVDLTESSIQITDTFTVRGDIDFKSGNIISKGSLKVTGNVNNEFKLNLSKNIEIGGYVGDAQLEAGGNIFIRGGFLGKGKGVLIAGSDIEVKFVENQKVFTRGSLTLIKEALNAKLYVKNKITTKGSNAVIVGGHTIAGDSIQVYSIGNSSESETIVEVGFDYMKRNSIDDNKSLQISLRHTLEEVDKNLLELAQMKRLNDKCKDKVKFLANEHKRIIADIENLKAENLKITNEIYVPTNSKISVNGTIYPGVKIGINGRFFIVNEPMRAKTFVLSKDNEVIAV